MRKVISTEKLPIKLWLEDIEIGALKQAKNLANLPFAFKHIAIMPDSHQGYGMPIGGVLATKGVIIPNAVGVDIGCGMCAVKTSLTDITPEQIKKIFGGSKDCHGGIRSIVPVGFSHHSKKQDVNLMPSVSEIQKVGTENGYVDVPCAELYPIVCSEYMSALKQLGTLGGGNHFIEIQKGSDGHIWIMVHSGSRNLGYKVAKHYNKLAQKLCKQWYSNIPEYKGEDGLAFLPLDSEEGQMYLREMNYCVDFALANRKLMMKRIGEIFTKEFPDIWFTGISNLPNDYVESELINIAHNYASMENHFGQNVMVHRKGATLARTNTIGIIPGSQGTKSYIVKGLGNAESFMSCSHGAGRKMSRTKAINKLDLDAEIKQLNDKGIIHTIRSKNDLDEAPGAYKNIETVMENQKDLVEVLVELTPLAVIKG